MRKRLCGDLTRGDVVSVESGEPDHKAGRMPEPGERVRIRLHEHPQTYTVRAETGPDGPQLVELTITADDGGTVDYAAVQPVVRRLAATAVQWVHRLGGLIASVDDTARTYARPELGSDDRLAAVARLVREALSLGLPVRAHVAAGVSMSRGSVDRLIRQAKDEGLLDDESLPNAPAARRRTRSNQDPEEN